MINEQEETGDLSVREFRKKVLAGNIYYRYVANYLSSLVHVIDYNGNKIIIEEFMYNEDRSPFFVEYSVDISFVCRDELWIPAPMEEWLTAQLENIWNPEININETP